MASRYDAETVTLPKTTASSFFRYRIIKEEIQSDHRRRSSGCIKQ